MRLLLLLCLLTVSYGLNFTRVWEEFKTKHKRLYSSTEEDLRRMKIFFKNLKQVERHNLEFRKGGHSFEVGVNEYSDWEHQEFVSTFNGFKRTYNLTGAVRVSHFLGASPLIEVPATADWRQHGYVTPVKNQGACGSCWAFSTTGSLEGQNMRKTNKLVSLSEQNLVDCSGKYGNQGCDGGLMDQAFQYIKDNNGIDTEESYPYEAENDKCRYSPQSVGAVDSGFVDVPSGDEQKLMEAVATIGPISVAIDASHMSFQLYRRGIYDEPHCSSTELDHGVLVVGYGTDSGHDYWLIKNSWGTSWGDSGYVKIARNMKNKCGVATQASYPIV